MHKLDILVTHYNESSEIVNRFLMSLSHQTFKDFEVTIVDDGLDCPELILHTASYTHYPFKITHLKKEHKTVSAARNFAIDNTSAPYFMMCDCDDMFDDSNRYGLFHAMQRIEMNDLYVYQSNIKIECWKKSSGKVLSALYTDDADDELIMTSGGINCSNVHCKIYKREFINKYNIRFLDDLWMNEDGAFNCLAYEICKLFKFPAIKDCEEFYIWKYNAKSVTRTNKLYPLLGYDQFIKATEYKYDKIFELMKTTNVTDSTLNASTLEFIFQAYYWLYLYSDKFIDQKDYNKYMTDDMTAVKQFITKFKDYIDLDLIETERFKNYSNNYIVKLDNCDLSKKLDFKLWYEKLKATI